MSKLAAIWDYFFRRANQKQSSVQKTGRQKSFRPCRLSSLLADLQGPIDSFHTGSRHFEASFVKYEDRISQIDACNEVFHPIRRIWELVVVEKKDKLLTKTKFIQLYLKMYENLHEEYSSKHVNDGLSEAMELWTSAPDHRTGFMNYDAFEKIMQHLVATWSVHSTTEHYVQFLQTLLKKISVIKVTYVNSHVAQIEPSSAFVLRQQILYNLPLHLVDELAPISIRLQLNAKTSTRMPILRDIAKADYKLITKYLVAQQHLHESEFYRHGEDAFAIINRLNTAADQQEQIRGIDGLQQANRRTLESLQERYCMLNQINPVLQTSEFGVRMELHKFGISSYSTMEITQARVYYSSLYRYFVRLTGKQLKALAAKEDKAMLHELESIGVHVHNLSRVEIYEAYRFAHADKLSTIALEIMDQVENWITCQCEDEAKLSEFVQDLEYLLAPSPPSAKIQNTVSS